MGLTMNIIGAACLVLGVLALLRKLWLYGIILVVVGALIGGFGFIV